MLFGTLLEQSVIFRVYGRDSERYLHSRLSIDVKGLTSGSSSWAAALSPQGKIDLFCQIQRLEDSFLVLIEEVSNEEEALGLLKRFVVADDVKVESLSSKYKHHKIWSDSEDLDAKNFSKIYSCFTDAHSISCLSSDSQIESAKEIKYLEQVAYELFRINNQIIAAGDMSKNIFFPDTGLNHLVASHAGCFVGQEPVEMCVSRGKAPNKIYSYKSGESFSKDSLLYDKESDKKIGQVLTSVKDTRDDDFKGFCLIRNIDTVPLILCSDSKVELSLIDTIKGPR